MSAFRIIQRTQDNEIINLVELDQIFSTENRIPINIRRIIDNALKEKHTITFERTEKPPRGIDYTRYDKVYQLVDSKGFTGFLKAINWYMKEMNCGLKEAKEYCDKIFNESIKHDKTYYCSCNSDGFRFNEKRIKICRNCGKPINEKKTTK